MTGKEVIREYIWGKGYGFQSDISHNDPEALQDYTYCAIPYNLKVSNESQHQPKNVNSSKMVTMTKQFSAEIKSLCI